MSRTVKIPVFLLICRSSLQQCCSITQPVMVKALLASFVSGRAKYFFTGSFNPNVLKMLFNV